MDFLSVSACVQAVTSAFRDAAGLVQKIREQMDNVDGEEYYKQMISELKTSLELGPPIVQGQYDSDFRKFGETYARGDGIAREQLKDVLINLQIAVLSNLTAVWMGVRPLDHRALQIASDDSRVNAVMCLMQWQQRLTSPTTAQQQNAPPYQLGVNSGPMTPALTNVSTHSDRSSLGAGNPFTPDEPSEQMTSLSMAATQAEPLYASSGHSIAHDPSILPRPDAAADGEMPSPLFARLRSPSSRQDSPVLPEAIPVRSPHRPPMTVSLYPYQPRLTTDYSRNLHSPVSVHSSEHDHFDRNDFSQLGHPTCVESPRIDYASLYSPEHYGSRGEPWSANRASHVRSTSSDHSTLEPVSFLHSNEAHSASPNDQPQSPLHRASFSSVASQNMAQQPPPPSPSKIPPSFLSRRTPSVSAPIPILNLRFRTTSTTTNSSSTTTSTPNPHPPSTSLNLNLPSESNSYLGFCKGAYKLQIGLPTKKAFTTETRPAGLYSTYQVWRCSKCSFEGPMSVSAALPGSKKAGKPEKMFDHKIRLSEGGIPYRWSFLAKCHVTTKAKVDGVRDGSFGTFGCLFCCAEGVARGWVGQAGGGGTGERRGSSGASTTPMFGNVESFMQHLEMHRTPEGTPGVEMQGRMKCVVGRVVEVGEDFDINLPPGEE